MQTLDNLLYTRRLMLNEKPFLNYACKILCCCCAGHLRYYCDNRSELYKRDPILLGRTARLWLSEKVMNELSRVFRLAVINSPVAGLW